MAVSRSELVLVRVTLPHTTESRVRRHNIIITEMRGKSPHLPSDSEIPSDTDSSVSHRRCIRERRFYIIHLFLP